MFAESDFGVAIATVRATSYLAKAVFQPKFFIWSAGAEALIADAEGFEGPVLFCPTLDSVAGGSTAYLRVPCLGPNAEVSAFCCKVIVVVVAWKKFTPSQDLCDIWA